MERHGEGVRGRANGAVHPAAWSCSRRGVCGGARWLHGSGGLARSRALAAVEAAMALRGSGWTQPGRALRCDGGALPKRALQEEQRHGADT